MSPSARERRRDLTRLKKPLLRPGILRWVTVAECRLGWLVGIPVQLHRLHYSVYMKFCRMIYVKSICLPII